MITVKLFMRVTKEPLQRTPVVLQMDADASATASVLTDRDGIARFDVDPGSGKVLVSGIERYHGRLDGEIPIGLWSMTQASESSEGTPGEVPDGSNAYPGIDTRGIMVDGREVLTDSEGHLITPAQWTEGFAKALAASEGLTLNAKHWDVMRYLRDYFSRRGRQASVREMIRHFRSTWDAERGSNRYLHRLIPRGGPQKQGNRLAGLLRPRANTGPSVYPAGLASPSAQTRADELATKVGGHHERQTGQAPFDTQQHASENDQGYSGMDGHKPGRGEFPHTLPPVAEGQIDQQRPQQQHHQRYHRRARALRSRCIIVTNQ